MPFVRLLCNLFKNKGSEEKIVNTFINNIKNKLLGSLLFVYSHIDSIGGQCCYFKIMLNVQFAFVIIEDYTI